MRWLQNVDTSGHCPENNDKRAPVGTKDKRNRYIRHIPIDYSNDAKVVLCTSAAVQRTSNTSDESSSSSTVSDMTRRMICGGLAGMIAKTATNPLERIKMLSQTGDHLKSNPKIQNSIIGIYKAIIQNEGIIGLWAGNGANLIRIFPAKAIVFSTNDLYRKFMFQLHTILTPIIRRDSTSTNSTTIKTMPSIYSFFAGGFAGMTASLATYPLDFARGRISGKLATSKGHKAYNGIIQTCVITIQDEGLLAVYKGVTPTLIGAVFYEGIKFGTVGVLEKITTSLIDTSETNHSSNIGTAAFQKMIYGGVGGVMAGLLCYPNDTVRRLLQLQGSRSSGIETSKEIIYSGYWDCVKKTYQAHGIQRFYHGITINLIRMAPNAAIQFGSYEVLKQWTKGLM